MEFAPHDKIKAIAWLLDELFTHVLDDEEPLFFSDEATMFDVSATPAQELQDRCSKYYRTEVTVEDLRRPLWQLLPDLVARRQRAADSS